MYALQRAVTPYFSVLRRGLSAPNLDPEKRKERAEFILLGNLRIVAYEQLRLQSVFVRNFAYVPDSPREHVFSVWTNPELIPEWWGADTVVEEMDVRSGGDIGPVPQWASSKANSARSTHRSGSCRRSRTSLQNPGR